MYTMKRYAVSGCVGPAHDVLALGWLLRDKGA